MSNQERSLRDTETYNDNLNSERGSVDVSHIHGDSEYHAERQQEEYTSGNYLKSDKRFDVSEEQSGNPRIGEISSELRDEYDNSRQGGYSNVRHGNNGSNNNRRGNRENQRDGNRGRSAYIPVNRDNEMDNANGFSNPRRDRNAYIPVDRDAPRRREHGNTYIPVERDYHDDHIDRKNNTRHQYNRDQPRNRRDKDTYGDEHPRDRDTRGSYIPVNRDDSVYNNHHHSHNTNHRGYEQYKEDHGSHYKPVERDYSNKNKNARNEEWDTASKSDRSREMQRLMQEGDHPYNENNRYHDNNRYNHNNDQRYDDQDNRYNNNRYHDHDRYNHHNQNHYNNERHEEPAQYIETPKPARFNIVKPCKQIPVYTRPLKDKRMLKPEPPLSDAVMMVPCCLLDLKSTSHLPAAYFLNPADEEIVHQDGVHTYVGVRPSIMMLIRQKAKIYNAIMSISERGAVLTNCSNQHWASVRDILNECHTHKKWFEPNMNKGIGLPSVSVEAQNIAKQLAADITVTFEEKEYYYEDKKKNT